jgi:hypothetical protein
MLIVGAAELITAQKDVLQTKPRGHGVEPAAHREVGDRTFELAERLHGARRHRCGTEDIYLRHVVEPRFLNQAPLFLDLQDAAGLANAEAISRDVQRSEVISRRYQPSHVLGPLAIALVTVVQLEQRELFQPIGLSGRGHAMQERACLIGQADTDERATHAFRAVDERWRDAARAGHSPRLSDGRERGCNERLVDGDAHALSSLVVVDDRLVACVAVVAKDERLHAHLNGIGRPRLERPVAVAWRAMLVVDRRYSRAFTFDQIDDGRQTVLVARQRDRTRMNLLVFGLVCRRHRLGLLSQRLVAQRPLDRVVAVGEDAFDPFVEEQSRAIDELVEHPRRQVLRQVNGSPKTRFRRDRAQREGQPRRSRLAAHSTSSSRSSSRLSRARFIASTFRLVPVIGPGSSPSTMMQGASMVV